VLAEVARRTPKSGVTGTEQCKEEGTLSLPLFLASLPFPAPHDSCSLPQISLSLYSLESNSLRLCEVTFPPATFHLLWDL